MQMKKILSATLAIAMLATSALSVMAEEAAEDVATNSIVGNNIVGAATKDVTANFAYTATDDASATVTVDVDENAKTTAYQNNFDTLNVGDTVMGVGIGTPNGNSYDGVAGVAAPVVDNPVRTTEGDNCIQIPDYHHNRYNIYDGTSYDATFWMYTNNTNHGIFNIQLKPDVYLAYRGKNHGDGGSRIGLYTGFSAVSNRPNDLLENGAAIRLAYVDLVDYGYSMNGSAYWRVVVTYNSVKVYINSVNDFTNVKPIIDVTLTGNKVNARSILQFSEGNTGMWIDDVTVKEIGNTPVTEGDEKGTLVKDVDFETHECPIDDGDFNDLEVQHVSNGNGRLTLLHTNKGRTVTLVPEVKDDYTATFYLAVASNEWHQLDLYIRDNWALQFRGTKHYVKTSGVSGVNGVLLHNGSDVVTHVGLPSLSSGVYIKYEYIDNTFNLWVVSASDYNGEFIGEPLLTHTFETELSKVSDWKFWRYDDKAYFDDIKLTAKDGSIIYENNFDMYSYGAEKANLVTDETTGNTTITKGTSGAQWNETTLFSTPENYEMTFYMSSSNNSFTNATVYIRNNIFLKLIGTGQNGVADPRYVKLYNGSTELDSYQIKSISEIGEAPFVNAYTKVIVNNGKIEVYASKTKDFAVEALILEATIDEATTTNTIRLKDGNTKTTYDNFKVYDLDDTGTNIGAGYKQVVLNGTDVKLVDVIDGVATELDSYTLPVAGARYRISVAKANGKLTVYVNGKSVIETGSTAAGLMFYEGANDPATVLGTAAPTVISAGDLDYNEGVDAADLTIMKKILLGLDKTEYYTEAVNADGDADLTIDIRDLIRIKKIMAGVA